MFEENFASFCVDSRQLVKASLFFALPSERARGRDGHCFLKDAAARGAKAAVIHEDFVLPADEKLSSLQLFRVPDVLQSLQDWAHYRRSQMRARVLAITGTVGKTTVKDFLLQLLKKKCRISVSPGNYNSHIGLPLAILNADREADCLILEMGMRAQGEIKRLIEIAEPEITLITEISLVHSASLLSLENIAKAKAEAFLHPRTQKAWYPFESPFSFLFEQSGSCIKKTFSLGEQEADLCFSRDPAFKDLEFPFVDEDRRRNVCLALLLAQELGFAPEDLQEELRSLTLPQGRGREVFRGGVLWIDDSYNSSPASLEKALIRLQRFSKHRRLGVLGDMQELGDHSEAEHRRLARMALDSLDILFCLGEESRYMQQEWEKKGRLCFYFSDPRELTKHLRSLISLGDLVLFKGSRELAMEKILEELQLCSFG